MLDPADPVKGSGDWASAVPGPPCASFVDPPTFVLNYAPGMGITVRNTTKRFGKFLALDHVSLEVPSGALVGLLGPSGSGKTTLLRIIAGLDAPDTGSVLYDGENVTQAS